MSSMNRSMLSPTFAESGDRAMLAAAMVSAALRMLVIMSGFLRGEEVDAVLQFVGRKHAVSDRDRAPGHAVPQYRSEEHTSELQSLMRISYAVFCLKKKIPQKHTH